MDAMPYFLSMNFHSRHSQTQYYNLTGKVINTQKTQNVLLKCSGEKLSL